MDHHDDKLKGKGNEMMGGAKEKLGDMTDNERMEAEGQQQKFKGKAQGAVGDAKEKLGDLKDKVT
jgi:uncharacterized protein YjbJ (UPF0337 family)